MSESLVGHVIFCDDMRLEVGNKPSFMGCYIGGEMSCPFPLPAVLPKFVVAAWVISDVDDVPEFIKFFIRLPDGNTLDAGETIPQAGPLPDDNVKKLHVNMIVPIAPFAIPCEGLLEVFAETNKGRSRIGRLKIVQSLPQQLPQYEPVADPA